MKKLILIATVLLLQGCFFKKDLNIVKDGYMDGYKTISVGEAFDHWNSCSSRSWSASKTDNGQRVVQFDCTEASVKEYAAKVNSLTHYNPIPPALNPISVISTFQWTINNDDTFQLSSISEKWSWADGTVRSISANPPPTINGIDRVKSAYDNKPLFDPSNMNESGLDAMTINILRYYEQ